MVARKPALARPDQRVRSILAMLELTSFYTIGKSARRALGDRPADWSVALPVYSEREDRDVEIGGGPWISGSVIAGDAAAVLVPTDLRHLSTRGDDAKLRASCRRQEDQLSGDNGKLVFREESWPGTSGKEERERFSVDPRLTVDRIRTAVDRRPADGGKWMVVGRASAMMNRILGESVPLSGGDSAAEAPSATGEAVARWHTAV